MARQRNKKRQRRKFTKEFKADAVELVRNSAKSIAAIALDLDLTESSLRSWVKQAEIDAGMGSEGALTTEEREELRVLRRENRQLRMELDFLKKAKVPSLPFLSSATVP
ncbi:MAG: transposase [Planctomycetes bacterium]|nr:transposase [Planctomycetota bacterium]